VNITSEGISSSTPDPFGQGAPSQGTATGSGFVADGEGHIVTAAHVVDGASKITIRFNDGTSAVATLQGKDDATDVAVLKVDPDDAELQPLPLGSSAGSQVGDPVVAIGNPFGYTRSVTTGIVSAKQRQITAPNGFSIDNVIQTDASVNPGNSGGPLLDAQGRVIGINSQIATGGSNGSVGIAFAVPIDTVKTLLPDLKRGEEIERAFLGIEMLPITEGMARDLNLPVDKGALVQKIVPGGPADKAGLKVGQTVTGDGVIAGSDLIVEVDGKQVESPDDVPAAIADNKPGDTVKVTFYRGDDRKTVDVELGKRPQTLQSESQDQGGGDVLPELP
jgi:S1-C subfamily serine protease